MLNDLDSSTLHINTEEWMEPACMERMYRVLKAICHPLRVKIIQMLSEGELCVRELVEQMEVSQSSISQHLGILHDKGILTCRKKANLVYYRLVDKRILQLIGVMRDVFCSTHQSGY
jgi:ArsR family transcriptional regulator